MIKFENEDKKKEAMILALQELKEITGWKIVKKVLEANIKDTEGKLFGEIKMEEGETTEELKKRRKDRILLRDLPCDLIKDLKEGAKVFPKEWDPYQK